MPDEFSSDMLVISINRINSMLALSDPTCICSACKESGLCS